jgi:alkanesulfonate monooxygenase SsuD/methylene tetrahydromethanopterin reductase-like flavin-dependent oxidoreductase (luciferase family)
VDGPRAHEVGGGRLPITIGLAGIAVDAGWWLESARRLEAAGYAGVATWDHLVARESPKPVLEAWTILTAAAATSRRIACWTHVLSVGRRHPVVLARMAATFAGIAPGRLVLGIGVGGNPMDHDPFGIPLEPGGGGGAELEEAVTVLRLLWSGERVSFAGRRFTLREAHVLPALSPPPPIVIAGQSRAGARLAARVGDGWTTNAHRLDALLPAYLDALAAAGRQRASVSVIAGWQGGRTGQDALPGSSPWIAAPRETLASWQARGVDGVNLVARTPADVDRLVEAASRW